MIFAYEAVNESGAPIVGELEAIDQKDALRSLFDRGLTVVNISVIGKPVSSIGAKASRQDLLLSLHEMSTLLESGVSISETLDAQTGANYPQDLKVKYQVMADEIRKGGSFSAALEAAQFDLPDYLPQLVKAGELTGDLGESLREGVNQFEYDLRTQEDLRGALIYPAVLVVSGIAAVLLIFVFVVPKLAPLVSGSNDLPFLSSMVLSAGLWFNDNIFLFLGGSILVVGLLRWASGQPAYKGMLVNAAFRFPVVGGWLNDSDVASWTSLMATLLKAKVSLLQALDLARDSVMSNKRKTLLSQVERDIRAGQGLADSLEKARCLTESGYNLIRSGERTGRLPEMMTSVAKLYQGAAKTRMNRMMSLIEPIAILLIGGVIGVIILGVILAITSVNEVVV